MIMDKLEKDARKFDSRNTNIELLRVISMLLIITTHFWGHGVDISSIEPFRFTWYFGWILKGISYISVNTFVIISAYFLCEKTFKFQRIINLWIEIEFYSIILYSIALLTHATDFTYRDLIIVFFPIGSGEYWFVTIYFGLCILSPFLNWNISHLSKRQHFVIILIQIALFSLIPNIFFFSKWLNFGTGYGIIWFIVLYHIGSFLRRHVKHDNLLAYKNIIRFLAVLFILSPFLSRLIISFITKNLIGKVIGGGLFFSNNSVIIVPATIFVFLSFLTFDIKQKVLKKIISILSAGSFAVYLIHDNPFISDIVWKIFIHDIDTYSLMIVPLFFFSINTIYLFGCIVDFPRRYIQEKIYKNRYGNKVDDFINDLFPIELA